MSVIPAYGRLSYRDYQESEASCTTQLVGGQLGLQRDCLQIKTKQKGRVE